MKTFLVRSLSLLSIASFAILTSCSSDDDVTTVPVAAEITITALEVGQGNNLQAQAGKDLHLEAEIFASEKIATVSVEIHNESDANAPEINASYNDYSGLLNATLHKHIDIAATQPAGRYHLHVTVTDQKGNTKTVESELEILAADVPSGIEINLTEIGHGTVGSSHAHAGDDMHVEGTITSVHPIATVSVEIHNESDPSVPEIEAAYSNYAGQSTVNFHEHIDIPASQPAGHYHFHLTVTDNQGHSETAEYELEIE